MSIAVDKQIRCVTQASELGRTDICFQVEHHPVEALFRRPPSHSPPFLEDSG